MHEVNVEVESLNDNLTKKVLESALEVGRKALKGKSRKL